MHKELEAALLAQKNPQDAAFLQRFFKTGAGEYGEGDVFLGVRVPNVRAVTKQYYKELSIEDVAELLKSPWHEVRLSALVAMTLQFPKAELRYKTALYKLYIKNIGIGINNWDLVDISCPHIVGAYVFNTDTAALHTLARGGLWQKRVAVISTFYFLRKGIVEESLYICELLVDEKHDLLQKAVGWCLREIGKIDEPVLLTFLDQHAATMPRTMLRYSLEKLPQVRRLHYMSLKNN